MGFRLMGYMFLLTIIAKRVKKIGQTDTFLLSVYSGLGLPNVFNSVFSIRPNITKTILILTFYFNF